MSRFVAFLRAINVGGHTVKMDRLRAIFESLGFSNVVTVIASGNVIFETRSRNGADVEKKIEAELRRALGYDVVTFVRTPDELREIAEHQPFAATDQSMLYVAFVRSQPDRKAVEKLMSVRDAVYDFDVRNREIYMHRRRVPDSAGVELEKIIGMPATIRNITTVRRLAAKCAS